MTVPQLRAHPMVQQKAGLSDIKNLAARLWGTLQHHTVAECPTVNMTLRLSPPVFWKDEGSLWRLVDRESFAAEYPEIVAGPPKGNDRDALQPVKRYRFTTAHQSWSYEDFVEGIKPVLRGDDAADEASESAIGYYNKDGVFYEACDEAAKLAGYRNLQDCLRQTVEKRRFAFQNAKPFALFIDEINRSNISAVLGELITLLEIDKRLGNEFEIADTRLPYSRRLFGVPANLHVYGTMNTADRSVEALDTALRRRFTFEEILPDETIIAPQHVGAIDLHALLKTVNTRLTALLDRDRTIGHAWLMGITDLAGLQRAFKTKILPLLQEFFYNDLGKVGLVLGEAFVKSSRIEKGLFATFKGYEAAPLTGEARYSLADPEKLSTEDFISIYDSTSAAARNNALSPDADDNES